MSDIKTLHSFRCDLNTGPCEAELHKPIMHQDALADAFRVDICRGDAPVDLSGVSVCGYLFLTATRQTILLTGEIRDRFASVTLTSPCYAMPGYATLVIQLTQGSVRHTVLKVNFSIARTGSEVVIDPNAVLPALPDLLAQIAAMEHATADAVAASKRVEAALEQEDTLRISGGHFQRILPDAEHEMPTYKVVDGDIVESGHVTGSDYMPCPKHLCVRFFDDGVE